MDADSFGTENCRRNLKLMLLAQNIRICIRGSYRKATKKIRSPSQHVPSILNQNAMNSHQTPSDCAPTVWHHATQKYNGQSFTKTYFVRTMWPSLSSKFQISMQVSKALRHFCGDRVLDIHLPAQFGFVTTVFPGPPNISLGKICRPTNNYHPNQLLVPTTIS